MLEMARKYIAKINDRHSRPRIKSNTTQLLPSPNFDIIRTTAILSTGTPYFQPHWYLFPIHPPSSSVHKNHITRNHLPRDIAVVHLSTGCLFLKGNAWICILNYVQESDTKNLSNSQVGVMEQIPSLCFAIRISFFLLSLPYMATRLSKGLVHIAFRPLGLRILKCGSGLGT
jgi:hypothetical protein